MTIRVAQGTVSISSALTVGQTIDITVDGAGAALTDFHTAAARAVVFKLCGRSGTGSGGGSVQNGTGFATGSAARRAYMGQAANGRNPTTADRIWRDDAVIVFLDFDNGSVTGLVDYDSEVTNGFRLIIDDQLGNSRLISWWAIWGDELSVAIHDFTSPAATGNQDYVVGLALNTGADDKAVIFLGGPAAAVNTTGLDSNHMLGVAAGNTPSNYVLLNAADDGVSANSDTWMYCKSGECIANSTAVNAISERGAVTQWNADGYRINWTEVNGTAGLLRYSALVLKGPQFKAFDILSRTDTTQTDEVLGFDPLGLMLVSHSQGESSSDTTQAGDVSSVGFATSATSRSAQAYVNADATGVGSSESLAIRTDCAYISLPNTSGGPAEDALLDIVDMSAGGGGGFTFVMDDVEPSASFIFGLAVGAALTAAAGSALHETSYPVGFLVDA